MRREKEDVGPIDALRKGVEKSSEREEIKRNDRQLLKSDKKGHLQFHTQVMNSKIHYNFMVILCVP